ncbi:YjdJ family protein [Alkalihalobacillus sp. AL-G]|uniref:YjdJ family protein n=1 Tax=Alkalihalobacillus sp. AL-G TaxID=2926399 RepID=UPI002729F2D6|nr:YjdJ family protein [Alkalihalobacillus sp. AL-G]WLD93859.1 YjdJ family protein [Alkalihalobacillus sp. AL-G]
MSFKNLVQFGLALMLLLFSTGAAWYEGSALLDNPWEWKHSTPVSQLLNGEITKDSDITQVDFFIYAAKFEPLFPVLMVISILYLTVLTGYILLKRNRKKLGSFLAVLGGLLLFFGLLISDTPTKGGGILLGILMVTGVLCMFTAFMLYTRFVNRLKLKTF